MWDLIPHMVSRLSLTFGSPSTLIANIVMLAAKTFVTFLILRPIVKRYPGAHVEIVGVLLVIAVVLFVLYLFSGCDIYLESGIFQ